MLSRCDTQLYDVGLVRCCALSAKLRLKLVNLARRKWRLPGLLQHLSNLHVRLRGDCWAGLMIGGDRGAAVPPLLQRFIRQLPMLTFQPLMSFAGCPSLEHQQHVTRLVPV